MRHSDVYVNSVLFYVCLLKKKKKMKQRNPALGLYFCSSAAAVPRSSLQTITSEVIRRWKMLYLPPEIWTLRSDLFVSCMTVTPDVLALICRFLFCIKMKKAVMSLLSRSEGDNMFLHTNLIFHGFSRG